MSADARDAEPVYVVGVPTGVEDVPSTAVGDSLATLPALIRSKSDKSQSGGSPALSRTHYLRAPGWKKGALITIKSLHPKDWFLFTYFLYSLPLLFIGADNAGSVVWFGLVLRLLVTPFIIFGRYFLAVVPDELHKRRQLFTVRGRTVVLIWAYVLGFVLDIIHIILCVYFYTEDGKIIANVWNYPADFLDDRMKEIDYELTGVPVTEGVGHYMRSRTSAEFNRAMGEYLSMCYIFFYFVIGLGYVIPYLFAPRYNFDQITTGMVTTYLLCLALFVLLPTAGPYWEYPLERPTGEEIGYFFGPLSQTLIEGGSSIGTAFPSSHCAITTATQVLSLVYFWPLGVAFLLICPAIVIATIWLGNHYVIDSLVGVCIGLFISVVTILIGKYWWPKVEKPLTGYPMYLRTMITARKAEGSASDAEAATAAVDVDAEQQPGLNTLSAQATSGLVDTSDMDFVVNVDEVKPSSQQQDTAPREDNQTV